MKGLAILGSTGSIGVSALEVATRMSDRLRVTALAAGRNIELLDEQIRRHRPILVSVAEPQDRQRLETRLGDLAREVEVLCGAEGARAVACHEEAEVVVCAMVGAVGLEPALAAIRRGITVAIANKEPLAIAGQLCVEEARRNGSTLLPVDSEHNAIFQAMRGLSGPHEVRRLLLTGSGGPFRTLGDLSGVTPEQALAHPTWSMGRKITIDSATLMNKGLEVIEARWLFDIPSDRIDVLIHPQSVVHSMVELVDGSILAQLGAPDMRLPIAHALAYPERLQMDLPRLDLTQCGPLTFEPADTARFPCLALARDALESGATYPAALNAANEVAVQAFLDHRLEFTAIPELIRRTLDAHVPTDSANLEQVLQADQEARLHAQRLIQDLDAGAKKT
jgi:1-deoxy-D-xylulose-5-phosphate reductoisomerase